MVERFPLQSLDSDAIVVTVGIPIVLILVLSAVTLRVFKNKHFLRFKWMPVLGVAIIVGVFIVAPMFAPKEIMVNDNEVLLKSLLFERRIPLKDVQSVRMLVKDDLSGTERVGAVNGFFGYYGNYRDEKLGTFVMFATAMTDRVLITALQENYIVSPEHSEYFIQRLQQRMGRW